MRLFERYEEPSVEDLLMLKERLSYSGTQMADLALVSNNSQWRKYTNRNNPRAISPHILFLIAAQLVLDKNEISRVLTKMRDLGAKLD